MIEVNHARNIMLSSANLKLKMLCTTDNIDNIVIVAIAATSCQRKKELAQ